MNCTSAEAAGGVSGNPGFGPRIYDRGGATRTESDRNRSFPDIWLIRSTTLVASHLNSLAQTASDATTTS